MPFLKTLVNVAKAKWQTKEVKDFVSDLAPGHYVRFLYFDAGRRSDDLHDNLAFERLTITWAKVDSVISGFAKVRKTASYKQQIKRINATIVSFGDGWPGGESVEIRPQNVEWIQSEPPAPEDKPTTFVLMELKQKENAKNTIPEDEELPANFKFPVELARNFGPR